MLSTDISDPLLVRLELANVPPQAWLNWHETVTLKARRRTKLNSVVSYKSSHVQKRVRISPGAVNHNYRGTHTHKHTVDSDARSVLADVIMSLLPWETDAHCETPTHTKTGTKKGKKNTNNKKKINPRRKRAVLQPENRQKTPLFPAGLGEEAHQHPCYWPLV